ncbi:hypothetical protein OIU79_009153 [Salix purpurea]|uniref:Uncharacterized protein n=1 Tax=Salix purpurea TaxID=77065 RepID=A0A9Q0TK28_SALPP|nr:hypothetical protein OIU79_009153 [Salix purpurea]
MEANKVMAILLAILLMTESLSEARPHLEHEQITRGKEKEEKRIRSSGGSGGRGRSSGRRSRGSSNCDPLVPVPVWKLWPMAFPNLHLPRQPLSALTKNLPS